MDSTDILDTSVICYDGDFDTQFKNILATVRLTKAQVENLAYLLDDIQHQLRTAWPECCVHAFGSIIIGLGIKTSDIDCFVETNTNHSPTDCVNEAKHIFKRSPHLFRKVFAISACKVPIVKLFHLPTQCNSDISFSGFAGVRNSELLAHLLHLDERAIKLAILVKYWSKVYDFTGTNLMPNYALTVLVVFYLQQRGILPSVLMLQQGLTSVMANEWNTAFSDDRNCWQQSDCNTPMYELLGEFFKYYQTFNFTDDIVAPYVGYRLKRKSFSCVRNVPNEYELYKHNINSRLCKPLRVDTFMCVQDTFEHNRNCTVAVYPRLAVKIVAHIKYAAELYERVDSRSFLKLLLTQDPSAEPRITNTSFRAQIHRNRIVKNNKQLFKKGIKDRFKAGLLTVGSFSKKKNKQYVPV